MRVLDIDLDFFLADCCPLALPAERPPLEGHEPWETETVRAFLEENLGLSKEHPVPGRIFETHDAALGFWQERVCEGLLSVPFSVTHIDAHSDLGIGKPGPGYVLNTVLAQPLAVRRDSARHYALRQLDEANYLLFALAYRYIDRLENVRNPKSRPDIPCEILKQGDERMIRLDSFASRLMEPKNGPEPEVPFFVYADPFAYRTDPQYPFDLMSVAISPRYAPAEADGLLQVLREYISFV